MSAAQDMLVVVHMYAHAILMSIKHMQGSGVKMCGYVCNRVDGVHI